MKKKHSLILILFLVLIALGTMAYINKDKIGLATFNPGEPSSMDLIIPKFGYMYCDVINPNVPLEYDAVGKDGYMGKGFWINCNAGGTLNSCIGNPGACGHNIYTDQCKVDYMTRSSSKAVLLALNVDECDVSVQNAEGTGCKDVLFDWGGGFPNTDGVWRGDWIIGIGKKMWFNPTADPITELGALESGDMKVRVVADQYGLKIQDVQFQILNTCDLSQLSQARMPGECVGPGCINKEYPQKALAFDSYFNYMIGWDTESLNAIDVYKGNEVYCLSGCGENPCSVYSGKLAPVKTMKDSKYKYADIYNTISTKDVECCPRQKEICDNDFKLKSGFDPYGNCPCATGWWAKPKTDEVCELKCNTVKNVCEPVDCHKAECKTNADCILKNKDKPICNSANVCVSGGGGGAFCGNKICEIGEDTKYCPQDCKEETSYLIPILIGIGLLIIILLIMAISKKKVVF